MSRETTDEFRFLVMTSEDMEGRVMIGGGGHGECWHYSFGHLFALYHLIAAATTV